MATEEPDHEDGVQSIDPDEVDTEDMFGSAIERREDPALVSGEAEYTDDIKKPEMTHMTMVRSQYAHAKIEDVDTSAAEEMDGVVAVYTAEDLDVPGSLPVGWLLDSLEQVDHPILAGDRVRYQGDAVAIVIAEERYQAHDAADAVEVEFERLGAVAGPSEALEDDATVIHDDVGSNQAFDWEIGDKEGTDEAFEQADTTVSIDLHNQLLIPNAIEPRATVADYHPRDDKLELEMTTQNPHVHRLLMSGVIDHPEHKLSIEAPDVGGGFGSKIHHYADEALTAWAAKQIERPVKWTATRTETYITDAQGRGHDTSAEMALDEDGNITGFRVHTKANIGAYLSTFAPSIPTYLYGTLLSGQYEIPNIYCSVEGAFTNVPPVDAYRGAGRPEASYVVERLTRQAAREVDMDPAAFRRQNFVPDDAFPYESPVAVVYDSGDYEKTLDKAKELLDYEELRERQEQAREEGRYIGVGLSAYIEACGLAPSELAGQLGAQAGLWESSVVRFQPSGTVTVYVGTSGHGQGHDTTYAQIAADKLGVDYDNIDIVEGDTDEIPQGMGTSGHGQGHDTTYAQIAADKLGVDYDNIDIVEGDTDEIPQGMGTYGSRSATVGGGAIVQSAEKIIEKGRKIAAHQLEADPEDVEFDNGEYQVAGAPDRSMTIQDVAGASYLAHDIPDEMEPGLEATSFFDPENFVFPFGMHAAVVEVDPDTGEIEFEEYVAVDDVGNQINPKIVEGQIHGGVAQGIGQALYEGAEYDENAQLVTGSMQDYAVPKSFHIPEIKTASTVTESPHNPLGVKGVGEAGTIAAPQAVVNAVVDALEPFGVEDIEMPLTNERVWRAIHENGGGD